MTECVHHWRIDEPDGVTSVGRCLKCGQTRTMRNSFSQDATGSFNMAASTPQERAQKMLRARRAKQAMRQADE